MLMMNTGEALCSWSRGRPPFHLKQVQQIQAIEKGGNTKKEMRDKEKQDGEMEMETEMEGRNVVVPPGFRFHPTDEELVDFYLRKKVGRAKFELNHVIPEVDLNKLEPWDLREKCKMDAPHQTEWYFFSHKDKKYPTGTRTNRATKAGFWKATGRDKAVLSSIARPHHCVAGQRIGMRKTLVFYKGRAPHGVKSDWIMHEYRLQDGDCVNHTGKLNNEDGWVVCRVFKKKNYDEKHNTRTSSNDNSNSNLSDELDPSPIKSTHSISKTEQSAISTLRPTPHQKPLRKEGEVINSLITPTFTVSGNNGGLFNCKQEMVGDHQLHYRSGLSIDNHFQPTIAPYYQLPYLESAEINACSYLPTPLVCSSNMHAGLFDATACSSILSQNQTRRLLENTQQLPQNPLCTSSFDSMHSDLGAIPLQYASKGAHMNEQALAPCTIPNLVPNPHYPLENLQQRSLLLQENPAKLQGNPEAMASLVNDPSFSHVVNIAEINKPPQEIDNNLSSYETDLWNFSR